MAQNNDNGVSRIEFDILKEDVKELHKVYDVVNRQTIATEKLALEMKYMREDHANVEKRVKLLEEKPVKRYDSIITQILSNIISIAIGALAVIIGLKK
jgi:hypothetical protein